MQVNGVLDILHSAAFVKLPTVVAKRHGPSIELITEIAN
jgi:hypothetical protein